MENSSFTKGMIIGSMIGASVGMVMNSDVMSSKSRKRMKKKSMELLRRSGAVVNLLR